MAKDTSEVKFDAHRPLLTVAAPPLGFGRGGVAWWTHDSCSMARMFAKRYQDVAGPREKTMDFRSLTIGSREEIGISKELCPSNTGKASLQW